MISIIIPVYNSIPFLQDCLCSILGQTYFDWECILVDDGSTDGSGALCDDFAAKDPRFRVIHQERKGVSSARNKGLDVSSGDWISFVDSDDRLEKKYLSSLFTAVTVTGSDLSVCGMMTRYPNGEIAEARPEQQKTIALDASGSMDFLSLEQGNLLFGPCAKLYRRTIIRDHALSFPAGLSYGEDLLFNLAYLDGIGSLVSVPEALYLYNKHEGTLSTSFRSDRFDNDYGQWKELYLFHYRKGLVSEDILHYLYRRLWGIVYDGVFDLRRADRFAYIRLKRILSIPEMGDLKHYQDNIACAPWIKRAILWRKAFLFYLFFRWTRKR
ncbi:MAG: glycosyltransferase [Bacteroidales bacterium]|nr:glycosyltransferase [Bacteroidales bacterium]